MKARRFTLSLAALAGMTAPALAQEGPAPVNTGKVSWTLGADLVTEYWFRGIAQENQGWILQPYVDATVNLIERGDYTLAAYAGTWNSVHFDNPTSDGDGDGDNWYEADFFAGVALGLPGGFGLDVSYLNLYAPSAGDVFAQEIDVAVSWDDTELMESFGAPDGFALGPYALVAFEIDGGSDAGSDEGIYLELGVEPSFTLTESEDYPLTLSIPIKAGFSIDDYYQDAEGDDDFFGYVDVGAVVSVPLAFIPNDYGAWTAAAGIHYIVLGDSAADIGNDFGVTGGEDDSIYGTFGISMSY